VTKTAEAKIMQFSHEAQFGQTFRIAVEFVLHTKVGKVVWIQYAMNMTRNCTQDQVRVLKVC